MIHVWVRTAQAKQDEERLLAESLDKNTDARVVIHWMRRGEDQFQGWQCDKLFKWAVPELMAFSEYAIILDDVHSYLQGDVAELMTYGQPGCWLTAVNNKVSVVDCSAFQNEIPRIKILRKSPENFDYEIFKLVKPQPVIPHEWNADDEFMSRSSKLIRYLDVKKFQHEVVMA